MSQVNTLFENIEPFSRGYLEVDEHKIYYEECGNPNGKPAVFLHGGPGGGGSTKVRGFFNPELFRIVVFDQRGCGRSKPHACLKNNTTWNLVEDIEMLKEKLKIKKWLVFGGSWGSTLALAYAQTYPNSVSELVLRGIFLCRKKDIQWFYQRGANSIYPDYWREFISGLDTNEQKNILHSFYHKIHSGDMDSSRKYCRQWSIWEGRSSTLKPSSTVVDAFDDCSISLAKIETHFFYNDCFIEENQIIKNIDSIKNIPCHIVHGRYDIVCPAGTAYELSERWPEASLVIAPFSGHSAFEKEITHELILATDKFGGVDR